MNIVKYICVQNEDSRAVENATLLQELSWTACAAPWADWISCLDIRRIDWSLSAARRSQEGRSNIWQQDTAKAWFYKYTPTNIFYPLFHSCQLFLLLHPALLNQGFGFSFVGKKSSALFFPQTCYPAVLLLSLRDLISAATAFIESQWGTIRTIKSKLEATPPCCHHFTGLYARHKVLWEAGLCKKFSSASPSLF